jgi:formylglycine-generating enzyme required for sulfatase activity
MRAQRIALWRLLPSLSLSGALLVGLLAHERPQAQEAASSKKVALLIGVNKYDRRGFRDLEFAERDVEEMQPLLEQAGYEVRVLTAGASGANRATLENIEAAVESLLKDRTKHDLVLIALAGHGLQLEVPGPDGRLQAESFFCPCDAIRDEPRSMLSMGKLFDDINRRGGEHNLVLVDACREDPTRGRGMDGGTVKALPEGVAILFGCRAGQKTYETKNAGGGHGVFFHYVLEGLRGKAVNEDGEVTWNRLHEYVARRLKNDAAEIVGDASLRQTPNLIANLGGESPVLLSPRKADAAPSPPPPPGKRDYPNWTPWHAEEEQFQRGIDAPALLVAPFDERTAKARQEAWARRLGKKSMEENSIGMKLVLIPSGEFMMGTPEPDYSRPLDQRQHRVRITQPFYLGMHEVTVGQFREFVRAESYKTESERDGRGGDGYNVKENRTEVHKPEYTWENVGWVQSDHHPVVNVTWNDAYAFCKWLSKKEGCTYRLATEAEWEYACRAGTITIYQHGDSVRGLTSVGNIEDLTAKDTFPLKTSVADERDGYVFTAPVGKFKANAFGLYDMVGNVEEWCEDNYRKDYEALPVADPVNVDGTDYRVMRGGSWFSDTRWGGSAARYECGSWSRSTYIGFRVVRMR